MPWRWIAYACLFQAYSLFCATKQLISLKLIFKDNAGINNNQIALLMTKNRN